MSCVKGECVKERKMKNEKGGMGREKGLRRKEKIKSKL
jgi:hypothetical protein